MEWLRTLVRPTVTWAMVGVFIYGLAKGLIPWEGASPIIGTVILFWFVERAIEKAKE